MSNQASASASGGDNLNDSVRHQLNMQQKSFLDANNHLLRLPMPQMDPIGGLSVHPSQAIPSHLSSFLLGQDAAANAALQGMMGSTDPTIAALARDSVS